MESILKSIKERRSIRAFKPEAISAEQLNELIEAARFAPSGTNFQPWRFLVVINPELKKRMAQVIEEKLHSLAQDIGEGDFKDSSFSNYLDFFTFFKDAPAVIAPLYKLYPSVFGSLSGEKQPKKNSAIDQRESIAIQSVSAAVQNILLAAHSMGLGGCWMSNPLIAQKELEQLLGVKDPWKLMALIPVGKPASIPPVSRRKEPKVIMKLID